MEASVSEAWSNSSSSSQSHLCKVNWTMIQVCEVEKVWNEGRVAWQGSVLAPHHVPKRGFRAGNTGQSTETDQYLEINHFCTTKAKRYCKKNH